MICKQHWLIVESQLQVQTIFRPYFLNICRQKLRRPCSQSLIIILPKLTPGKTPTNASSYRLISLTCTLCKIFEKLVNMYSTFIKSYLHSAQSGFRCNRSTPNSLVVLRREVCHAFANHQYLIAIFIDRKRPSMLSGGITFSNNSLNGKFMEISKTFLTTFATQNIPS